MRKATHYLLLFMLVLAGLMPTLVGAQGEGEVKGEQDSNMVLRFPAGLTVPEEIKQNLPDWVKLEKDGTLPEKIVLPSHVKIPETVELPERMVKVPETQKDGSIVWKEYKAPAVTIRLGQALKNSERAASAGYAYPYYLTVRGALWGHCDQGINYAKFHVSSSASNFQVHSYLPTWVPNDNSVGHWDLTAYGPGVTDTTLCIPKTLYWMYINPFPHLWFPLMSAYNSPFNWWMTYN